jgi:hypothetical protein
MLLNHLPISFSEAKFAGFNTPYESSEQLKSLRKHLAKTHFVLRVGEQIALFPYEVGAHTDGMPATFDVTDDHSRPSHLPTNAERQTEVSKRTEAMLPVRSGTSSRRKKAG